MSILKRIEQRRLKNIHAPHGPGSSRVTVNEASIALRDTLYRGFDEKTQKNNRTEFAHFLNEEYGIPMQTAYGKLHEWRIEEWEVYGIKGIVNKYCNDKNIKKPIWPEGDKDWKMSMKEWHSSIANKMEFYNYLRERGMCRTKFQRIISGAVSVTKIQLVGIGTAFNNFAQKQIQGHMSNS